MVKVKKQKVRPRRAKISFSQRFSIHTKGIIKFLIAILLVGGIGICLIRLKYMFVDSEYFLVKGVDFKIYDEKGALRTLFLDEIGNKKIGGTNIFFVDLKDLKNRIEENRPEFKDIVVRRLLPNKLVVQGKLRKAVAQIRSDRYYFVDKEGVLLPNVNNFPEQDLTIIIGIGVNLAKVPTSKFSKFEKENLSKALNLINEMESIEGLSEYKLRLINIADPGNISFSLEGANVEIKIGSTDFRSRLEVLATVLEQIGLDIDKFKYIDLRFEDPIVGPL